MTLELKPPTIFLMGPPGAGKTTALTTFLEANIETFVMGTEPGFHESLLDAVKLRNLNKNLLHYKYIPPTAPKWKALRDMATLSNSLNYKELAELKSGVSKLEQKAFFQMLDNLQNFQCDRTGLKYGDVTEWGPERAFALDSLSGLNLICQANTVGFKPALHQGEWGVAMNLEEQLINKLASDCKCFFSLIAHVEREPDEITGSIKITAGALGRKLGPKLPRFFSEVIRAERTMTGGKHSFTWKTIDNEADLKNRALPVGINLPPSFLPIINTYADRVMTLQSEANQPPAAPATPPSGT